MLLISWAFPYGDFLHTCTIRLAETESKPLAAKNCKWGWSHSETDLVLSTRLPSRCLTGEPLFEVQREITFLFKLWLQNRTEQQIFSTHPNMMREKSIYTNGIQPLSCGMARHFLTPRCHEEVEQSPEERVNRRHHVQNLRACGAAAGDGGHCHFP